MAYEMETIRISQSIYYYLLCNGKLEEYTEKDLYRAYVEQEEVMNLVKSQGKISDCQIERYGTTIYLMPNMGNTMLGFGRTELKKRLCKSSATNRDYYLSQFVILTLLVEFYDGQGSSCKSREYIKLGEFQNILSERLKSGLANEEKDEEENSNGLDYKSMSDAYETLKSGDNTNRSKTTKEGFLYTIIGFLEEQELIVFIKDDDMIKTTQKLDNLMEMKILNKNNYLHMMEVMEVNLNE
jgi:hypothetical protein